MGEGARDEQQPRARGFGEIHFPGERLLYPAAALIRVPPQPPEQPRSSGNPRERLYFAVIQGPGDSGAQIA